jgi:hypothetical protein
MQVDRKTAFAVDSQWYKSLAEHKFLKDSQICDHPTDLLIGSVESEDANGVWIKPDERFSEFSKGSLFIPWRYIVSAVLLGADEEARFLGFGR